MKRHLKDKEFEVEHHLKDKEFKGAALSEEDVRRERSAATAVAHAEESQNLSLWQATCWQTVPSHMDPGSTLLRSDSTVLSLLHNTVLAYCNAGVLRGLSGVTLGDLNL